MPELTEHIISIYHIDILYLIYYIIQYK